jgi:hypothetical protein
LMPLFAEVIEGEGVRSTSPIAMTIVSSMVVGLTLALANAGLMAGRSDRVLALVAWLRVGLHDVGPPHWPQRRRVHCSVGSLRRCSNILRGGRRIRRSPRRQCSS